MPFRGPTNTVKLGRHNLIVMNVDFMLLGHGLSTHQEFRSQRRRRIRDISHENEKQGGVITTPQETMECFLHRSRTQFAIHDDQRESGLKNNTQLLLCKKSARYQVSGRVGNVHCIVILMSCRRKLYVYLRFGWFGVTKTTPR